MSPDATPLTPRPTVDLGVTSFARRRPGLVVLGLLLDTGVALGATQGWRELGQVSINGIVTGTYFALGAVGLSLVFGVLRLVNFAHGDFLTFAAYIAILVGYPTLGLPIVVAGPRSAVAATAGLPPSRRSSWSGGRCGRAAPRQLPAAADRDRVLAFVIRNAIQPSSPAACRARSRRGQRDERTRPPLGNVRVIGRTQLIVVLHRPSSRSSSSASLPCSRRTRIGKQMRALSDNLPPSPRSRGSTRSA